MIDPSAPSPRFTGLTIAYGYTKATSFEPSADAYRMIAGKNAFFGYTTSPLGETWWFARAPSLDLDTATSQNLVDLLSEAGKARELILGTPVPAEISEAILAGYGKLGDDVPVAVRSSATAEDLPFASFAGQQDTYLNVVGGEAVLDAVR